MKANQKIVLSALAAGMLLFTGCGGGGAGTGTTTSTPTSTPTTPTPVLDATLYDGLGADDVAERHIANDAMVTSHPLYDAANVIVLPTDISSDMVLNAGKQYEISGLVSVKSGWSLTIPAGTVLFGDTTGDDFMVVEKGAQIFANGTANDPVIFTSKIALEDPTNADVGQWGGLTVLGAAPTNHADPRYEVDETNANFAFGNVLAGSTNGDPLDDSGVLRHVKILNSGVTMSTDQEVNGLSLAGVGSNTVVEDITVVNSSDDGIEIWGGTVDVTRATLINCQDDSFDLDYGYVGTATDIKIIQTDAASHAGMEISSGGTNPMTAPTIKNFVITKVAGTDEGGIYIKDDSTAPTFINGEVMTHGTDAGIHTKVAFAGAQTTAISFTDVLFNSTTQADGAGSADALSKVAYSVYDSTKPNVLLTDITADTTLVNTNKYEIAGLVSVKSGFTLTIPAGTVLYGDTSGDDFIVVEKGARIVAIGTDDEPIYFTSKTGLDTPAAGDVGQWGGLTILGAAPTNHADPRYEVDETNANFAFGNALANTGTVADDSGSLVNVHILNSGVTMSTDQEVNGLSLAGVGSGTTVENIYVGNSSDDGIEIWGGTVNVTNATMVNCQDDSFDLDYGYIGTATNIFVQQLDTPSHAGFEISSGGNNPMTAPTIKNFVINKVATTDEGGIYIKDDTTAPTFVNGLVTTVSDANIHTKVAFDATQKSNIAFRDVILLKP